MPEDGVEEQEKCRKRIKTDAHDNPFVAAGKLAGWILQGSTQSQGKAARCACLARLHLKPRRFSVPVDGMEEREKCRGCNKTGVSDRLFVTYKDEAARQAAMRMFGAAAFEAPALFLCRKMG